MTIHSAHPFQPDESARNPVRQFRGRLASPVSIWTSNGRGQPAGLTVSSMLVADGDPGIVVGIVDPLADLWDALQVSQVAVVNLLGWAQRGLADVFGYVAPAPGGPFRQGDWVETPWGPALSATTWAGCRLAPEPPAKVGWGLAVHLRIERVELAEPEVDAPLVHRRGRYGTF
ncbi:flavin reductase (DIM6/NTAB) family NADH-FMN oxidoreductase RutF [Jatrophihabitans sp. GAS493]|uniref:flavin reductase family protein n=1 Tax=Jatrophihabitans sp. GAS493 TaxID=1907575 RepID=UPI000BC04083|nr:flavin reductase family protein [Jatrophihabitans sp. GAS493]SOD71478.1 flavin reductase (DIM6/NTAB) family NADH-FMN oxidoreductase RutF [Jatrophihabitans sp. GAS493]